MASAPWLFGLPENAPEPFSVSKHYFLVAYSFATWIYRFFLFLGIALLVYSFAFKLLGIFLFAVEIIWFIGRPVFAEMKRCWTRRAMFSMNRQTRRTVRDSILLILAFAPADLHHSASADRKYIEGACSLAQCSPAHVFVRNKWTGRKKGI